jgi:Transposase
VRCRKDKEGPETCDRLKEGPSLFQEQLRKKQWALDGMIEARPEERGADGLSRTIGWKCHSAQAHFIWKHRHLLVTRPEHMNGRERGWLSRMFDYLPELRRLRRFVLKLYKLFDPQQTPHQARCRRAALVNDSSFQADPDLAKALAMLSAEKFDKMIAYLHSPVAQRVRTNNHVERTNRRLRYFEKVRYKWRRRRTIVRFIVLAIDRWHQHQVVAQTIPRCPKRTSPTTHPTPLAA